jgi:hypothetical protein
MGFQYGPDNVWFIFNHVHDAKSGFTLGSNSVNNMNPLSAVFFVGNLIENLDFGPYDSNWSEAPAALLIRGSRIKYFINNTVNNVNAGVNFGGGDGLHVENNIFQNITRGRSLFACPDFNLNNLFSDSPCGSDINGNLANANAQFVNPSSDYHLQNGSPARDAGFESSVYQRFQTDFGLDIFKDFQGNLRGQGAAVDMGGFESGGGGSTNRRPQVYAGTDQISSNRPYLVPMPCLG